eukprot:SAG11_NODE_126_length_15729_cov_9.966859_6_plen_71_part_00
MRSSLGAELVIGVHAQGHVVVERLAGTLAVVGEHLSWVSVVVFATPLLVGFELLSPLRVYAAVGDRALRR